MREKLYNELIQSVLLGEDLEKIAEKSAKYLNNPVVIINNSYNIIAHSKEIQVNDITWNNAVNRGYITLEFAATLNNWNNIKDKDRKYECLTVNKINKLRRRFYKLVINSKIMGYLNVIEVNDEFDDVDEECYHFVSQVFAKEIFTQQKIISTDKNTKNEDILLALAGNNYVDRLHFLEHVKLSNLNIKSKYQVACCDITNFLSYNADEDILKDDLLKFFPSGTIVIVDKILTILIDVKHTSYIDFSNSKKFNEYLNKKNLTIGISDVFHDLFDFKRYESEAIKAYKDKKFLLDNHLNYVFYEQVKPYDLLYQIPKKSLIHFCNQKIWNIYEYDRNYGTSYLNTLYVYLQTNHSVKVTSSYLYLHRNTINYRIVKIKELFRIELDDDLMLNQFLLSCQIVQILIGPFQSYLRCSANSFGKNQE